MEILTEKPITMLEVKEVLESIEKKNELSVKSKKTKEYLNTFVKLDKKKVEEFKKKLEKLDISRLRDRHIVKIIDLMPDNTDSLKVILSGENITLKVEDLEKIISIVKEFE